MEKACGKPIAYKICPRREGDAAAVYADASLAAKELKWKTKFGLEVSYQFGKLEHEQTKPESNLIKSFFVVNLLCPRMTHVSPAHSRPLFM